MEKSKLEISPKEIFGMAVKSPKYFPGHCIHIYTFPYSTN